MTQTSEQRQQPVRVRSALRGVQATTEVLYLAPGDVGKGRVEPILWMQTCHAYSERGLDVTLITLGIRRPDAVARRAVWKHFGIEPSFRLVVVPTPLGRDAPTWLFRLVGGLAASAVAAVALARQTSARRRLVIHSRSPILTVPFLALRRLLPEQRRPMIVFETHALPPRSTARIVRAVDLVVVTSRRLFDDIQHRFGIDRTRILYSPLGPHNRIRLLDKFESRAEIGLPAEAAIVCYAGKMTREHNEFLLQTASRLVATLPNFRMLLVGGNPEILNWSRARILKLGLGDAVVLAGFVPPARVDVYQAAADVLVYHMPSSTLIFPYCTPAKGFEYQAAGRPIVATDFPLFEEVFGRDGERAIKASERTPNGLAEGVCKAFELGDEGQAMTKRAAAWVRERTWEARVDATLERLGI
jgi:glycosyltransferase involved in cell wall biosynthesis